VLGIVSSHQWIARSDQREPRMRIVLDRLAEVPILYHAATKAGIHRKTLEYWLRRSAAGDAGYDIEWQGIEWRFHEHCTSAIDEADDSLRSHVTKLQWGLSPRPMRTETLF
jgi:hypothetical protein